MPAPGAWDSSVSSWTRPSLASRVGAAESSSGSRSLASRPTVRHLRRRFVWSAHSRAACRESCDALRAACRGRRRASARRRRAAARSSAPWCESPAGTSRAGHSTGTRLQAERGTVGRRVGRSSTARARGSAFRYAASTRSCPVKGLAAGRDFRPRVVRSIELFLVAQPAAPAHRCALVDARPARVGG